jgi:translation initiation factor IF-2
VRIAGTAKRAAEAEGVEVRLYDIIYKLTEDLEAALAGMLEPEIVETIEGRAEVRQIFSVGKSQQIAGSYVTDGRMVRGGARIYRNSELLATDKVSSVRRFKDDVREVAAGYECGIAMAGFHQFEEGDIIESYTTETVARAVTR